MKHTRAITFTLDQQSGQRTATGCLVPWNTISWVTDDAGASWYPEFHARGSLTIAPGATIPVYAGHDSLGNRGPHVGDVVQLEDRPDGLYGRVVLHRGIDRLPGGAFSIEFDAYDSVTDPTTGAVARMHSLFTGLAFTDTPQFSTARVESFRAHHTTTQGVPMNQPMYPTQPQQQAYPQNGPWPQQQAYPTQPQQQQFAAPAPVPAPAPQAQQQPVPAFRGNDDVQAQQPAQDPDAHRRAAAMATTAAVTGQTAAPTAVVYATPRARFRGIGEFMQAVALGKIEREERDAIFRALAINTTADTPGLMPEAWVTEIVDFVGTMRPFITSFSQLPLSETGMTIPYPRITQKPTVAKQAAQNDEVSSQKTLVTKETASVETYAGGQRISIQEIQRTDPTYLTILFETFAEAMATTMDAAAIAAAAAVVPVGNKINMGAALTVANFKELNAKLVSGLKKILAAKVPLDVAYVVGVDMWEMYAAAVDADGRPLFPHINGLNPVGSIDVTNKDGIAVRTVPVTVDWNMTATKGYLGWKRAFTTLAGPLQTLSADAVANLGRDEAVFQFGAFAARRPDALVEFTLVP